MPLLVPLLRPLVGSGCLDTVAAYLSPHFTYRLLTCHFSNRNPPNFITRDQHQGKVAAILLSVKARRDVGHPLGRLLVVMQIAGFELNRVNRPTLFCDQIEGRLGEDGDGNEEAC